MKTLRYFFAIAASALMMFSCQKDAEIDNLINGGKLTFRFEIPEVEQVEVTRGAVEETEAYDVAIFVFNAEGELKADEKFNLTPTGENSYTRIYEHESSTTLPAGEYDIYAIANTSNTLWSGLDQFKGVMAKDEFDRIALTMEGIENTSTRMTLSGHTKYTVAGNGSTLAVNMQLSRPYAKVTFNVKSGNKNPNFTFTPTSYDIYNVPAKSRMFDNTANLASNYKNFVGRAIAQNGTFEYWQLENAFNVVSGVSRYTDREKRVSNTDRTFANAPAQSTYVVIYGEATETDANGNTAMSAKVNYTIHLGDFSPTGNMGNFSVNHNTHYTYNVTVNGVDMIEVEARKQSGNYENGAEGTIIDMTESKQVYNLDAHYETVLLQLDVDALHVAGVDAMTLSVSTPIMEDQYKNKTVGWSEIKQYVESDCLDEFYAMYDAKWVEFLPVSSAQFVAYPGVDEYGKPKGGQLDICSLMEAIDKKALPEASDGLNYVVAFVNEFYYDDYEWPMFVNKQEGREMKILQSPEISADQHSIWSQALCAFHQKSISTMFDIDAEGNVFGIEMYDETGKLDISTSNYSTNKNNGWRNTQSYTNPSNRTVNWLDIVNNGGYNYNGQPNGNAFNVLKNTNDASYACMQRNRDLNGNKTIDNDEIRWYMPAINQLIGFWYGEASLPTYARLYQGDMSEVSQYQQHNQLSHIYTSTSGSNSQATRNNRIFWAIEGSSFGPDNQSWQASTHSTRCVRNLNEVESPNNDEDLIVNVNNFVVKINGFNDNAYRLSTQVGQYPPHTERDIANKLPKSFKVAKANLSTTIPAATYTIKAPQISSANFNNGTITLTFASEDDGVEYYYNTSNSAGGTKFTVNNNQATISSTRTTLYIFARDYTHNQYSNATTVTSSSVTIGANKTVSGSTSNRATDTFTLLQSTTLPLCANYTEENGDVGLWRVPNQRELTIIHTYSSEFGLGNISSSNNYLSSTMYSNRVNASQIGNNNYWRYAYCNYGSSAGITLQEPTTQGHIRCVRDVAVNGNGSMNGGGGMN